MRRPTVSEDPTVFVVEDDPVVLRSLVALIEVVFPRVEAFVAASDFLAAYAPGRSGCLVLDVAMPRISGIELQRRLAGELPIVFITGHGNVRMAVEAIQSGAVDFLEKPVSEQELWGSIQRALERDEQNRRQKALRAEVRDRFHRLSRGEQDVLSLILGGKHNKEIADELGLSVRTVEDRRARIMTKMDVRTVAQLVQLAATR